jgi:hypothetical protein
MDSHAGVIKDFERDRKTQKELEQELSGVDPEVLKRALRDAKKEASKLK